MTPEKKRAYDRAWYHKNKAKILAKRKAKVLTKEEKAKKAEADKRHRLSAQYNPEKFVNYLYGNAKQGADKRGLEFSLTKKDIMQLCIESKGKCALSGLPLSSEYNDPMKASIDRIDSDIGYTRENVHLVGTMVNIAKNKYSVELFVEMCKGVARNATV
jgi:hypothetical protein